MNNRNEALDAIRERVAKATPGPWLWQARVTYVQIREGLATGSLVVVDATLVPRLGRALEKLEAQLATAIKQRDEARMQMAAKDRLLISSATENAALRAEVKRISAS